MLRCPHLYTADDVTHQQSGQVKVVRGVCVTCCFQDFHKATLSAVSLTGTWLAAVSRSVIPSATLRDLGDATVLGGFALLVLVLRDDFPAN